MDYARIVSKLREQIIKFSGELSFGWPKVARRFIAEVVYGIQARQSVRLTEIARSLEERIPLRKTGNGKLKSHCNGKQKSHCNGKLKSHQDGNMEFPF